MAGRVKRISPVAFIQRAVGEVRQLLPEGGSLPAGDWRGRHRAIVLLLWLHALGIPIFGLLVGNTLAHSASEGAIVGLAALLASLTRWGRRLRAGFATLGLLTASAVLVHLSGGYVEFHFHFFITVALIALYEDWTAFLLAISYVVLEHGVLGALAPAAVYNHPDGIAHPWKWAGIHGLFVLGASAANLATWRLNELTRARTGLILNSAGEGIYGLDLGGVITFVNPAATRMLGYQPNELVGQPGDRLFHGSMAEDPVRATLAEGRLQPISNDLFRRKDGTLFPVEYQVTPIHERGRILGAVVTFRDITERKRAEAALEHQALHDALTGLPNRALLRDRLQQALLNAQRDGESLALLLLDLDRFKEVNDTLGHQAGDQLLQQVAERLRGALRASDTLARLGGDEFAVVLPTATEAGAVLSAERLTQALEAPFLVDEQPLEVRASIGIALFPDHADSAETLQRRADVAMYVAKRAGSGAAIYNPAQDQYSAERLALVGELRQAITAGALRLHYQPKVDVQTGRLLGAEALVRWQHPQRGLVPPDQFIALAEQTGLIRPLTHWVLDAALRQCAAWRRAGREVPIAVNLSMRNLLDTQLPTLVAELLARHQVPPALLKLEITESAVMADPQRVIEIIRQLRALGVEFAVDDFGTGYSSLSYLKQLAIQQVKIDRSFVKGLAHDANDRAIVRATIELGHQLGLDVVAEGVEDRETLELLRALACDGAQGYYLSRPMPAAAFEAWLDRASPPALARAR